MLRIVALLVPLACAAPAVPDDGATTSGTSTTLGAATFQDVPPTGTSDSTTTGVADAESTGRDVTTGELDTGDTTKASTESESSTAVDPSDSESNGSSSSDGGTPQTCDDLECGPCVMCQIEGECAPLVDQCEAHDGCAEAAECLASCGVTGVCLDDCCDGIPGPSANIALDLNQCFADTCGAACQDYNQGICD